MDQVHGCHNERSWMKMSVRTSFSSGHPRPHLPADAAVRPHGRPCLRERISLPTPLPPSPLSLPPLYCPHGHWAASARTRIFLLFSIISCRFGKRETIYNFPFSVFNPQNPRNPRTLRALRAKPREEEGFFGLVPLVTHPSSIPLLGGLTPKFLSLSLHSL
jgi:hypothetical protein